jgi:lipopolysaccharide/colanic/teichoic acid biosynthesis glycosyltransferase
MNITLKKDSWHFKIYSKVLSDKAPKSLCPYFWQWVVIILTSPILILIQIMIFLSKVFEAKPKPKKYSHDMTDEELQKEIARIDKKLKRSERAANIVLGVGGTLVLAMMVLSMYLGIKKVGWFEFFKNMFAMVGLMVSVYWTIVLLSKTSKKIGNMNFVKVPLDMINAIYTKTCPIINWK